MVQMQPSCAHFAKEASFVDDSVCVVSMEASLTLPTLKPARYSPKKASDYAYVRKLRARPLRGGLRNLRPKTVSGKGSGRPRAFPVEKARSALIISRCAAVQ